MSTPYPQTPSVFPDSDSQREQKRRRIAPAAHTPGATSLTTSRVREETEAVTNFAPALRAGGGETPPKQLSDWSEAASHSIGDSITLENILENPLEMGQEPDAWRWDLDGWGDV